MVERAQVSEVEEVLLLAVVQWAAVRSAAWAVPAWYLVRSAQKAPGPQESADGWMAIRRPHCFLLPSAYWRLPPALLAQPLPAVWHPKYRLRFRHIALSNVRSAALPHESL
jgi:hypothetical protein